ncbi:MAG: DUF6516 family protein [Chloroflexota bacterium]
MNPFQSLREYEVFIYTLQQQFPAVQSSTLVVAQRGRYLAELTGEVMFARGHRLSVYERLAWEDAEIRIEDYGYEVWQGSEKLYWYDSQPHPDDASLASTHPHHKDLPPDIKHHRLPAPDLSFTAPNLSFLIGEIEALAV